MKKSYKGETITKNIPLLSRMMQRLNTSQCMQRLFVIESIDWVVNIVVWTSGIDMIRDSGYSHG